MNWKSLSIADAQQYAADEMTIARAQVAAWDASTTAGNTWNTATTLAATQFIAAGYSAQAAALSGLVSAMPTTPVAALGRDWAQYRAGLAGAESAWWSSFVPTVMTNTYLANLSASAYQAQVDAAYLSASGAASQADADYIVSQAAAGDNQAAADARADMAEAVATADATCAAGLSVAADKEQYLVSQALHNGAYTQADEQADDAAAGVAYTLATAVAADTDTLAVARDKYAAVTAAAESTASWTQAKDAAALGVTVAESQAYAAEQMNLASLAVSTSTQMGDSYAAAVGNFAQHNPTPWAQEAAANAAAAATYNDHALLAWLAGQNKTLAAQSLMEIGTARTAAVLADQTAAAALASTLAGAVQQLANARSLQLGKLAAVQAAYQRGEGSGAPSVAAPGMDAAYVIAQPAAADYNMSGTVAAAHAGLVADVYHDPWQGWWDAGASPALVLGEGVGGTPCYSAVLHQRMEGATDWTNITLVGGWHGGWNDGAAQGLYLQGLSVIDPNSTAFQTFVAAHAPSPSGNGTVAAVAGVSMGLFVFLASDGNIVLANAAGMGVYNGVKTLLNDVDAGRSPGQIVCDTLTAGGISFLANYAGSAAAELVTPAAAGFAGAMGLTCGNGLGAVGAFIIGASQGAAFCGTSTFVETALATGDLNQALNSGMQAAVPGFIFGGVLSAIANEMAPFVCFTAGTQVVVAVEEYGPPLPPGEGWGEGCWLSLGNANPPLPGPEDRGELASPPLPPGEGRGEGETLAIRNSGPPLPPGEGWGEGRSVLYLHTAGEVRSLAMKEGHPLFVAGKGWAPAQNIRLADKLLALGESVATVAVTPSVRRFRLVTKNIEDILSDDLVLTRDENDPDGPLVLVRVDRTFRRIAFHLRILSIDDICGQSDSIETTDEHPFFERDRGRVDARDLKVGDVLVTLRGRLVTVTGTRREEHLEGVPVYNFRVPGTHTYFVRPRGSTGDAIWVHNASACVSELSTVEEGLTAWEGEGGAIASREVALSQFQGVVDLVNERLAQDPSLAQTVLRRLEVEASVVAGVARMNYGNAIERLAADVIDSSPSLNGSFEHLVGPGPDFKGIGPYEGMTFEITTLGQVAAHRARPYGGDLLIATYVRPPWLP